MIIDFNYLFTNSEYLQGRTVNFSVTLGMKFHQKSLENTRKSKFPEKYSSHEGNSRYK